MTSDDTNDGISHMELGKYDLSKFLLNYTAVMMTLSSMAVYKYRLLLLLIMTFSPFISHSTPIFCNLKILPLEYIYKYNLGITFYKINNSMVKVGTHNLIYISSIHKHETRLSRIAVL